MQSTFPKFSRYLLLANAVFNALGAVILCVAPRMMIEQLGLGDGAAFLIYLLAVAAAALAMLSFCAFRYSEPILAFVADIVFLVFHFASALVSVWYICFGGGPVLVWGNTAIHVIFGVLFCFGVRQISEGVKAKVHLTGQE